MPPKRGSVPTLEPIAAPLSAEERKERQRLHVKRNYYKKLNAMQTQRDRVRQLEQQYARLVAKRREDERRNVSAFTVASPLLTKSSGVAVDVDLFSDGDVAAELFTSPFEIDVDSSLDFTDTDSSSGSTTSSGSSMSLRDLYTEIAIVKEQLHAENESMRNAIEQYESFSQKLASWAEAGEMSTSSSDELSDGSSSSAQPRLVAPISVEFCQNLARSSLEDMRRYRQNQSFITTGVSVFGWRDKRIPVDDRVKFSLKKTFHGVPAFDLSLRGWGVLASPKPLASLFSASLNCKMYKLQAVDDDNTIMLRVMSTHDGMLLVKTVFLVTRFAIPTGYVVFVKSIDPGVLVQQAPAQGTMEKWVEHCTWITFERDGEDGKSCTLEFGGEVQTNPLAGSSWILEILFIVLRFEGKVQGPIFSIC